MEAVPSEQLHLSEIVGALTYALDLVEGQPPGHALRSCLIGMRLAEGLQLGAADRSALFYALLLKDAGCSANASRVTAVFGGDDARLKYAEKLIDRQRSGQAFGYLVRSVAPDESRRSRLGRMLAIAKAGKDGSRELTQIRCERGAEIARMLDLPEATAVAIHSLDEHWNGRGYPDGLAGEDIPLLSRVAALAQAVDVFADAHGVEAARAMALDRAGRWFDPDLVELLLPVCDDPLFWSRLAGRRPRGAGRGPRAAGAADRSPARTASTASQKPSRG